MNILALDYGKKRIGMAWVQSGLDVVLPFGVIEVQSVEFAVQSLGDLVEEEKINKIVIGLPVGLDGKANENTEKVKKFVVKLESVVVDCDIAFVDERFSSKQADAMGGDVSRDEKAAMVILQSYLDIL